MLSNGSQFTREKVAAMIEAVMAAQVMDAEADAYLRILEENVPHPEVFHLMFYSEPELTPSQAV